MTKKRTHEEFVSQMSVINPNIEVLGQYLGDKIKIKCRCKIDNYEWDSTPYPLLKGHGCIKCAGNLRKTHEEFVREVYDLVGDEYSILGIYENCENKISIKHNKCGNVWGMKPNNFLNGQRCPRCQHRNYKKTTEEFKDEIYQLVNDEYIVLGEYINNKTKILFKHLKCNNEFCMEPYHFLNGIRCPNCNESKGEKEVESILKEMSCYCLSQYRIKECKDKKTLPFDFAVFYDKEKIKLKCLIEYDGELHYKPFRKIKSSEEKLRIIQHHDEIKNNYCEKNDIKLIRIPYWEFSNIRIILKNEI